MADDVTVSNSPLTDYVVDTTEMSDGSHKQHVGIDISTGTTPDRVTSSNPLPVTGTVTSTPSGTQDVNIVGDTVGLATAANQLPDGHNVTIDNASGASAVNIQDGGNSITVDGSIAITSTIPGTGATNLGKAEDAVHASGDTGVAALTRRVDTPSSSAGTSGDYATLNTDSNGRVYSRTTEYGTSNLPNFYANILGLFEIPGVFIADPTAGTAAGVEATGGQRVAGTLNHDSVDSGSPVKVGGRATDIQPDTTGLQGPTAVADGDRTNLLTDLQGRILEAVTCQYSSLTGIEATYNNTTTTNTSTAIDCSLYRMASFGCQLTKANTPTDMLFEVQVSLDGTNYQKAMNGPLGSWLYDDTAVGTSGIAPNLVFPIACQKIRIKVTASGTTASNTFTIANARLYLRN